MHLLSPPPASRPAHAYLQSWVEDDVPPTTASAKEDEAYCLLLASASPAIPHSKWKGVPAPPPLRAEVSGSLGKGPAQVPLLGLARPSGAVLQLVAQGPLASLGRHSPPLGPPPGHSLLVLEEMLCCLAVPHDPGPVVLQHLNVPGGGRGMGVGVLETARTPGEARPPRLSQVGQRDSGATTPRRYRQCPRHARLWEGDECTLDAGAQDGAWDPQPWACAGGGLVSSLGWGKDRDADRRTAPETAAPVGCAAKCGTAPRGCVSRSGLLLCPLCPISVQVDGARARAFGGRAHAHGDC